MVVLLELNGSSLEVAEDEAVDMMLSVAAGDIKEDQLTTWLRAHVESLAADVARITGESKTEATRRALKIRRAELAREGRPENRRAAVQKFLENEVWPLIPSSELGRQLS